MVATPFPALQTWPSLCTSRAETTSLQPLPTSDSMEQWNLSASSTFTRARRTRRSLRCDGRLFLKCMQGCRWSWRSVPESHHPCLMSNIMAMYNVWGGRWFSGVASEAAGVVLSGRC